MFCGSRCQPLSSFINSPFTTGTFQEKGVLTLCLGSEAQPVLPTKPFPIFQRLSADVTQPSKKADELTRLITLTSLSDLVHVGGKPPKALPVVLTLPMLLLSTSHLLPLWVASFLFMAGVALFFLCKVSASGVRQVLVTMVPDSFRNLSAAFRIFFLTPTKWLKKMGYSIKFPCNSLAL